jgi:hypothetical protein
LQLHLDIVARMPERGAVLLVGHANVGYFIKQYATGIRSFAECRDTTIIDNAEIIEL